MVVRETENMKTDLNPFDNQWDFLIFHLDDGTEL